MNFLSGTYGRFFGGVQFSVFAFFIIGLASFAHAENFKAFSLSPSNQLAFAADPRLDASDNVTVELTLAIAAQQLDITDDDAGLCLVSHGDDQATNWQISLHKKDGRDALRFGRKNSSWAEVIMPLRGRGYHNFMFVVAGGHLQIIVDGKLKTGLDATGTFPKTPGVGMRMLAPSPTGRDLSFGCDDGPNARAWISDFRLWDTALRPEDYPFLKTTPGYVAEPSDLSKSLMAFALFTSKQQTLRFMRAPIKFTALVGLGTGKPNFHKRPPNSQLRTIALETLTHGIKMRAVEFAPSETGDDKDAWQNWRYASLPTLVPRQNTGPNAEAEAWVMSKLRIASRDAEADLDQLQSLLDQAVTLRQSETTDTLGTTQEQASRNDVQSVTQGTLRKFSLNIAKGMRLGNVSGNHTYDRLKTLQFGSSSQLVSSVYTAAQSDQKLIELLGQTSEISTLPTGAQLEGLVTYHDAQGFVTGVSLGYSDDTRDDQRALRFETSKGVWLLQDDALLRNVVSRDPEPPRSTYNGSYTNQTIFRFFALRDGASLQLHSNTRPLAGLSSRFLPITFEHESGHIWKLRPTNSDEERDPDSLFVFQDRIIWNTKRDDKHVSVVLVRPDAYQPADKEKLPWGATFSLDHRPQHVDANFMGYHPAYMRANDYAATTGANKRLFKMPEDSSRDYVTTGSRVIVPHGLHFSLNSKGSERGASVKLKTQKDRQISWTVGLGGNVGIPVVASFKADASHQQGQENITSTERSLVHNRAIVTHYALVLDKARMELDDRFRARILQLASHVSLLGADTLDWDSFFEAFGTHYPYAVTYGGFAWSETTTQMFDNSLMFTTDDKASVSGSGILDDLISVGAHANTEISTRTKDTIGSVRDRSVYGTYGGSFSKGGGWSVNRGEELPVLLDLRPIHELLSPVFFDDRRVYVDLRREMETRFATHYADIVEAMKTQYPWTQKFDDLPPVPTCAVLPSCGAVIIGSDGRPL